MPTDDVAREDVHLPPSNRCFSKGGWEKRVSRPKKTIYSLDYHITGGLATNEKHGSIREAEEGLATPDGRHSPQRRAAVATAGGLFQNLSSAVATPSSVSRTKNVSL